MKLSGPTSNSQKASWLLLLVLPAIALGIGFAYYKQKIPDGKQVTFENIDGSRTSMNVSIFERAELLRVNTGTREFLGVENANYALVVLLSGGDCQNCLREKEVWGNLLNTYGREQLIVVGVLVRTSFGEAKTFTKGIDFPFPVFLDDFNRLGEETQLPQLTPFKVLLKNGKVVLAEGPNSDLEGQRSFGRKIEKMLNESR